MNYSHVFILYVICLLITYQTKAEDSGFYIGGSIGYSNIFNDNDEIDGLNNFTITSDNDELGWKLYGGYYLNKYFGAEVAMLDFGEGKIDLVFPDGFIKNQKTSVDGFSISGIGKYPLTEELYIFGKVGVFFEEFESVCFNCRD